MINMRKLPNAVSDLSIYLPAIDGGLNIGAKLFSISRLGPHKKLGGTNIEDIEDLLNEEFRFQQTAVNAGLIKPGAELQPEYAREVMADPSVKGYTVMAVAVPEDSSLGYKVVAMVRPDAVKFANGELVVKLWYTPIIDLDYVTAEVYRGNGEFSLDLETFLMRAAITREKPLAGRDPLVFTDDQGGISNDRLQSEYGFQVLLDNVVVPHLAAKGPELYRPANVSTLLVRPNQLHGSQVPLPMSKELVTRYLNEGYGVPLPAKMIKDAVQRLEEKASGSGFVPLSFASLS